MKRNLVLEYRIIKLEKALLENIDSDLDKMSDDILKKMPSYDLDAELDKSAKDIIDKEPGNFYKTDPFGNNIKTYDTIEEWLDDKTVEIQLNPTRPHKGNVVKELNGAIKQLTNVINGLNNVRRLKNYIKEISDMNVLIAQHKLVNALRKRIKDIKNRKSLENITYEGKQDQKILNDFLGDDYYNKYQTIKNRIYDPDYKDIYKLIKKNPDEVKYYIDNFKSNRDFIKAAKEGARKVYEDSDWIVYHITNYDAAKYYGRDTKWCLSGNYDGLEEVGQQEFEKYNSKSNIYFYINKHKAREKYAILKNRYTDRITDVYDSADHNLGNSAYYINVELPYVEEVGYNTASQLELYDAIKEGDLENVKDFFNKDFVNMKDHRGVTPLMIAVIRSYEDIAEFLIKNDANVNAQNNTGETPLMYACFENNLDMVKLLVKYGADVNVKTEYGTPLTSTDDEGIKEYLISKGAKID